MGTRDQAEVTIWAVRSAETLGAVFRVLAARRQQKVKDTQDETSGSQRQAKEMKRSGLQGPGSGP